MAPLGPSVVEPPEVARVGSLPVTGDPVDVVVGSVAVIPVEVGPVDEVSL
jgi:hypothetical protein